MKVLRSIWSDIRRGHNLDLYPTVVISLIVLALSLLGVASEKLILSITLAVLALLSVALLINRRQNEQIGVALAAIQGEQSASEMLFRREDDLTEIIALIRESRDVWLWGSTLSSHLPVLEEEFRKGLDKSTNFRVLLIGPSSKAVSMAAFRAENVTEDSLNTDLMRNLARLERLAAHPGPGRLECRIIDYLGPYVLYLYDPQTSRGRAQIRLATFRGLNSARPTFELQATRDREWFGHFVSQFEQLWNSSQRWPVGKA